MGLALEAEFPVLVLVLFGGEDGFDDVPELCSQALNSVLVDHLHSMPSYAC